MVVAGGDASCSLRPAYTHQIAIRLDETDKCFYYDCFECKPAPVKAECDPLPTNRDLKLFKDVISVHEPRRSGGSFDDYSDEEEDERLDRPVELVNDTPDNRKRAHQQATIGKFLNSRVMRIKVPLESICGMRLCKAAGDQDDDGSGVLIIELSKPTDDFAFRHVASPFSIANSFRKIRDWTPQQVAGRAMRHMSLLPLAKCEILLNICVTRTLALLP